MRTVVLDFETASGCDLKVAGSSRYAQDPTTEILCLSFEYERGVITWSPFTGKNRDKLEALVADPEVIFVAHNAGFEKDIWRHIMVPWLGFADVPNARWDDTMAACAMKQLPQELDKGGRVLGLPSAKDMEGSRLTVGLSRPNKKTGMLPERTPAIMERVARYCEQDVRQQRLMRNRIGPLPPSERRVWLLDQTINERGVRLDLDYVRACRSIVDQATKPLAAEFVGLTGLNMTQSVKLRDWVIDQGVDIPNLAKETIDEWLGSSEDDDSDSEEPDAGTSHVEIPPHVHRALSIRRLVGSASIKKLARMEACAGMDGRVRRMLQYHGAGPGRWAGRLLQPQNFPRGTLKLDGNAPDPALVVAALMSGDADFVAATIGPPVETVVSGLRHALVPAAGYLFVSGDFAQIEARIVLALAGQRDKVALLAGGADPYVDMAQTIYGRPIDKKKDPAERQVGKNSVLGLGFGMGWRKFLLKYLADDQEDLAHRAVDSYRQEWAPAVPELWRGLEQAALRTVWDRVSHEAYGVRYCLEDGWLTARLPSGRKLWYWNPQPVRRAMPWDELDVRPAWTYQAMKVGKWTTIDAFGGLLTENVVQALARDLLVDAMFKLEAENFPLVLTVHDECLAEVQDNNPDRVAFEQIMCDSPVWAKGLGIPVAVESWVGDRYRK